MSIQVEINDLDQLKATLAEAKKKEKELIAEARERLERMYAFTNGKFPSDEEDEFFCRELSELVNAGVRLGYHRGKVHGRCGLGGGMDIESSLTFTFRSDKDDASES